MFDVSDLMDVAEGRRLYIRMPGFLCEDACRLVSRKILDDAAIQQATTTTGLTHQQLLKLSGQDASDPQRSYERGLSYYEAKHYASSGWGRASGEDSTRAYYALAEQSRSLTRRVFAPYESPLDGFMRELDKKWGPGSSFLNLGDGAMFSGLLRVLTKEVLAHEDKLERDHGALPEQLGYIAQFSINTYIQVPESGGALMLWDQSLDDEQYRIRCGATYGIAHDRLGPPDACITPEMGELVVFNSRKLHGVSRSQGRGRISLSSFMAYCGKDKPFYLWS
jgi:hypothetical protein